MQKLKLKGFFVKGDVYRWYSVTDPFAEVEHTREEYEAEVHYRVTHWGQEVVTDGDIS